MTNATKRVGVMLSTLSRITASAGEEFVPATVSSPDRRNHDQGRVHTECRRCRACAAVGQPGDGSDAKRPCCGRRVWEGITEEKALEMVAGRGGQQTQRWAAILGVIQDNMNHYGNLVVYLRLNGIVPPRSASRN